MATIRFKDKNGNCFILYVADNIWGGGDYNTPAEAETIPETITMQNRCSNTIIVPTASGNVTLNFALNGRTGSCNQCGQCCVNCANLVIKTSVGKKNGTECAIYNRLLYEGLKGCVGFPASSEEIANCPDCGFSFP